MEIITGVERRRQRRGAQRRGRLVAETPAFLPLQVVPELAAPAPPGGSGPPLCATNSARHRRDAISNSFTGAGPNGVCGRFTPHISVAM